MNKPYKVGVAKDGRPKHFSAGAIIEDIPTGALWLLDRRFPPFGYAGLAGHIDEGEEPGEAIQREAPEEIGTELLSFELLLEEEIPWNFCTKPGESAEVHHWFLYKGTVDRSRVVADPHEAKASGWFMRPQLKLLTLEPVWNYFLKKFEYL